MQRCNAKTKPCKLEYKNWTINFTLLTHTPLMPYASWSLWQFKAWMNTWGEASDACCDSCCCLSAKRCCWAYGRAPFARNCELNPSEPIIPIPCIPCIDCPEELVGMNWDPWTIPVFCLCCNKETLVSNLQLPPNYSWTSNKKFICHYLHE